MRTHLFVGLLFVAAPLYAGGLNLSDLVTPKSSGSPGVLEPGGYLNPIVIEKHGETQLHIKPELPTGHDILKPGGYMNPYIVRERPNGDLEIRPSLPID